MQKEAATTAPTSSAAAGSTGPTAQLTATPTVITAGDQVQLTWRTTDATSVSIDGLGDVPTSGVKTVTPTASTSYHLVARGEGGTGGSLGKRDRECAAGRGGALQHHDRGTGVRGQRAGHLL